ncbi:MAG: hypothetical protein RDO_1000 [Flavobacteriales endosymbiont of Rhyzopertha dominica]
MNKEIVINNQYIFEKNNNYDFAIWIKSNNKIMKWASPWGYGYPGWHIGCTTINNKLFGNYFDIHGGGIDLKFPHHECEIALSNIINNNKNNLAKYWIHTNMLNINNKKMSKSLNNYILLNDIIKGKLKITNYNKIHPIIIKFYLLNTHYRNVINISKNSIFNSIKIYNKIKNIFKIINKINTKKNTSKIINIDKIYKNFYDSINDDFNIPLLIYNFLNLNKILKKCLNKILNINNKDLIKIYNLVKIFFIKILGLKIKNKNKYNINIKLINNILNIRNEMRKNKEFYYFDKLRKILNKFYLIKDNKIIY